MDNRYARLPPLNSLRAFIAVMNHGSLRGAADSLLVSPQAVSQQIKLLEDILNISLFTRKGRIVEPTEQAIVLARFVQSGFNEFEEGVRRVTQSTFRNRININVSPYFATHYLMQRLEKFRTASPGADIRLTTMVELPEFAADDVDVAIQWGFGQWRDFESQLLVSDPKVICCTPELANHIKEPQDLTQQTLLQPVLSKDIWSNILRYLGVNKWEVTGEIQVQDAATMERGAVAGIGVGLVSREDALKQIEQGTLVAPFGVDALVDMPSEEIPGFYLVLPKSHKQVSIIYQFYTWIIKEVWDD
jgi:LysR family glycine cleavage system transcriptional activator